MIAMVAFTNEEYFNILGTFHRSNRNAHEASRLYAELDPGARLPSVPVFLRTYNKLIITGSVMTRTRNRDSPAVDEIEGAVLEEVENNPQTSTRAIAADVGASHTTVRKVLIKHCFHPFKACLNQELLQADYGRRNAFCNWILGRANPREFVKHLMMSDECSFSSDGHVNRHNMHYWSSENPHWMREVQNQGRWTINVWCGVLGDQVIGPFFFDDGKSQSLFFWGGGDAQFLP